MRPMEWVKKSLKLNVFWGKIKTMKSRSLKYYVICVQNQGYEVSLEKRKIYRLSPDVSAHARNLVKVYDESGQSYLYPARYFMAIKLPQPVLKAFHRAA